MLSVRRDGLPPACRADRTAALVAPANRPENQLVEPLLEAAADQAGLLKVLLADRAFDDDALRDRLPARGVFLSAPIARAASVRRDTMAATCAAIGVVPWWSEPTVGFKPFAGWSSAMNGTALSTTALSRWLASFSPLEGCETGSS